MDHQKRLNVVKVNKDTMNTKVISTNTFDLDNGGRATYRELSVRRSVQLDDDHSYWLIEIVDESGDIVYSEKFER